MLNLSSVLLEETNKLSSNSAWLVLLEITVPEYPNVIRLVKNNIDIVFAGDTYTAFPLEIDSSSYSSNGNVPTLDIKISNIANTFTQILKEYSGGIGATVVIKIVSSEHLTESFVELEKELVVLNTDVDNYWVVFTVGTSNPLTQRFPLYIYAARHCNWTPNFKGAECKYVSHLVAGIPTVATVCNGTLTQCEAYSNTANFGGFPGLYNPAVRIV